LLLQTTDGGTPTHKNFAIRSHRRLQCGIEQSCLVTKLLFNKSYRRDQSPLTLFPIARLAAALAGRPCHVANPSRTRLKMVRRF